MADLAAWLAQGVAVGPSSLSALACKAGGSDKTLPAAHKERAEVRAARHQGRGHRQPARRRAPARLGRIDQAGLNTDTSLKTEITALRAQHPGPAAAGRSPLGRSIRCTGPVACTKTRVRQTVGAAVRPRSALRRAMSAEWRRAASPARACRGLAAPRIVQAAMRSPSHGPARDTLGSERLLLGVPDGDGDVGW